MGRAPEHGGVIEPLVPTVPVLKALHIGALILWCGGLLALPFILIRHAPTTAPERYDTVRIASHLTYILCVTPAAVIAVIAGTWLIFLREVFSPWLYAKLALVGLLVIAHARIGHLVAMVGEEPERPISAELYLVTSSVIFTATAILFLVLAKPSFAFLVFPEWLSEPRGYQLPFDVPSR